MAQYRALTGLDYPPNRRIEAGDVADDIPAKSIKWLLAQGLIEAATGTPTPASKPAPVKEPVPEGDDD